MLVEELGAKFKCCRRVRIYECDKKRVFANIAISSPITLKGPRIWTFIKPLSFVMDVGVVHGQTIVLDHFLFFLQVGFSELELLLFVALGFRSDL